jgi:hypothetical protein
MEQDPPTDSVDQQIFDSYFAGVLDEARFRRASNIFRQVGAHNERSVAIQFFSAIAAGKTDEVLATYDEVLLPGSPFHELDEISRALGVRRIADYVYMQVICEGDQSRVFTLIPRDTPPIFDEMGIQHERLN